MNPHFPEIKKNFGFGMMRLPMVGDEVDMEQTIHHLPNIYLEKHDYEKPPIYRFSSLSEYQKHEYLAATGRKYP